MDKYEVNEADFEKAVRNAGPLARRRLFKKMGKVKFTSKGPRPPADIEEYVTNFVITYKDKAIA